MIKTCPIWAMSPLHAGFDCNEEVCAWWDGVFEQCMVVTQALAINALSLGIEDYIGPYKHESEED